jgi:hypothetical protein
MSLDLGSRVADRAFLVQQIGPDSDRAESRGEPKRTAVPEDLLEIAGG